VDSNYISINSRLSDKCVECASHRDTMKQKSESRICGATIQIQIEKTSSDILRVHCRSQNVKLTFLFQIIYNLSVCIHSTFEQKKIYFKSIDMKETHPIFFLFF